MKGDLKQAEHRLLDDEEHDDDEKEVRDLKESLDETSCWLGEA